MRNRSAGFTIVELLIVIVVIAILAAMSGAAYTGIQQRGRDSQRLHDVKTISKAIELYYIDNDKFPTSYCSLGATNCKINASWSTTSDGTWSHLESQLVPDYISSLPKDPLASVDTPAAIYGGYNYDYVMLGSNSGTEWCGRSSTRPLYILTYRLESGAQKREIIGNCIGNQPLDYQSSEHIVIKN